ncbi:MAG: YqaA family protein [Candidatus Acidiferrales bacterium]
MQTVKLPHWLQTLVATLGGGGIFVVAFLDSSVLSFPFVTDALVIESSIVRPARMPYYCAMAAAGSLAGCVWLYLLAKKGGEAYFQRRAGRGAERIRSWVDRNAFVTTFVPAILPPPFPFKVFVLADGVFQVPLRTFVIALLVGRGLRYFVEGMLAVRYGPVILKFAMAHETMLAGSVFITLAILYIVGRSMFSGPRVHM